MPDSLPVEIDARFGGSRVAPGITGRARASENAVGIAPGVGTCRGHGLGLGLGRTARAIAICALLATGGCGYTGDAEVGEETAKAPPPAASTTGDEAAKDAANESGKPPARSAYGKAMEAAHRLEDKVDAYNKKLEQAADDAFK